MQNCLDPGDKRQVSKSRGIKRPSRIKPKDSGKRAVKEEMLKGFRGTFTQGAAHQVRISDNSNLKILGRIGKIF
ncbi:hypothetical protein SLA2020_367610 [Shorea laevis]